MVKEPMWLIESDLCKRVMALLGGQFPPDQFEDWFLPVRFSLVLRTARERQKARALEALVAATDPANRVSLDRLRRKLHAMVIALERRRIPRPRSRAW